MITRAKKGALKDCIETELYNGVTAGSRSYFYGWQNHNESHYNTLAGGADGENYIYDLEPDVFYVVAPGLKTTFIINKSGEAHVLHGDIIRLNSYEVNTIYNPTGTPAYTIEDITKFSITSPRGDTYIFETHGNYLTHYFNSGIYIHLHNKDIQNWYLDKIITSTGNEICYTYDNNGAELITDMSLFIEPPAHEDLLFDNQIDIEQDYVVLESWYNSKVLQDNIRLKKITFNQGSVEFNYLFHRQDIPDDYALSQIKIKDYNNDLVYTALLEYGYLKDSNGESSRLRLDKITVLDPDYNVRFNKSHEFEYYEGSFPKYNSYLYDYYGYYSNNGQNGTNTKVYAYVPSGVVPHPYYGDLPYTKYYPFDIANYNGLKVAFSGQNRTPNLSDVRTGMLKKIYYPNGGQLQLNYELNQFKVEDTYTISGGGLRIASQKLIDEDNNMLTKSYEYSNAEILLPRFATLSANPATIGSSASNSQKSDFISKYTARYDQMQGSADLLNGSHIMYGTVKEIFENNGHIEYSFETIKDEMPDYVDPAESYLNFNPASGWPFLEGNSNLSKRGKLNVKKYIDKNNNVLKTETYTYTFKEYPSYSPITVYQQKIYQHAISHWIKSSYDLSSGKYLLTGKTTTLHDGFQAVESFDYGQNTYLELLKHSKSMNNGEVINTYPIYLHDADLVSKFMPDIRHGEVITNLDDEILYGTYTSYEDFSNSTRTKIAPFEQMKFESANTVIYDPYSTNWYETYITPYFQTKNIFSYDEENCNLIGVEKVNDISVANQWGYDNCYPEAQAMNANYKEIYFNGFEHSFDDFMETNLEKHSGQYACKVLSGGYAAVVDFSIADFSDTKYKYSAWVKTTGNAKLIVKDMGDQNPWLYEDISNTQGDWQLVELVVDISDPIFNGCTDIRCEIWNDGASEVYVDDVRFQPVNAQMFTYTFKPMMGVLSKTDCNNLTTHFELDEIGRLSTIRDDDKNIVEHHKYNYKFQNTPVIDRVVSQKKYRISYTKRGTYCIEEDAWGNCVDIWDFNDGTVLMSLDLKNNASGAVVNYPEDLTGGSVQPDDDLYDISESLAEGAIYDMAQDILANEDFPNTKVSVENNTIVFSRVDNNIKTDLSPIELILNSYTEVPNEAQGSCDPICNWISNPTIKFELIQVVYENIYPNK